MEWAPIDADGSYCSSGEGPLKPRGTSIRTFPSSPPLPASPCWNHCYTSLRPSPQPVLVVSRSLTLPSVPPQPCRVLRFVSAPASISPSIWGYLCSRGFVSGSRAANSSSSGLTSCAGNVTLLDASGSVLLCPSVSTKLLDFQKIYCCLPYLIIRWKFYLQRFLEFKQLRCSRERNIRFWILVIFLFPLITFYRKTYINNSVHSVSLVFVHKFNSNHISKILFVY